MSLIVWKVLGSLTVIGIVASIFYSMSTRNVGTPFMDSLNMNQLRILRKSSEVRKSKYMTGTFIGILVAIVLWRYY